MLLIARLLLITFLNTFNLALKLWNKILNLGTSAEVPEDISLIRFLNKMSFLSILTGVLIFFIGLYSDVPQIYLFITICVIIFYSNFLVLNAFGKTLISRILNAFFTPIWASFAHILIGGFFSQSLVICTSIVITFVSFQKIPKLRIGIIMFTIIVYLLAIVYTTIYTPILGVHDFPFDDIFVFIGTTGWMMGALILIYNEREEFIISLSGKNIQLQEATEELERFSYIASHDLKSPLRTITSFIGLIERDIKKGNYDTIQDKLHFVKSGAEQMNFLVQDILELSKLKNSEDSERVLINLNLILEKARTNLTEDIKEQNVTILAEKLPEFYCNEVEFLLLFQNFIQNGIKYNKSKNPIISISAFETESTLSLSFRDNGIGIAKEYHQQIFQFFKRLHNSNEYQGTGLGLGLCNKIIKSHGGKVEIDSVEGAGSTFTLTFPIEKNIEPKLEKKLLTFSE